MSEPTQPASSTRHYHHGDLRRQLLRAARDEIARRGANAVSLASLARLAGVSQAAPYRHFPDRQSLLDALAADGFVELGDALAAAMSGLAGAEALHALALAYTRFGETNVEIYRLMFASRLTPEAGAGSDLDEAAGRSFDLLRNAIRAKDPAAGRIEPYLLWAQLHGLVMLKADGFIAQPLSEFVDELSLACDRGRRTAPREHSAN